MQYSVLFCFFFSSRRRHTRWPRDWSSDVCSSDLDQAVDHIFGRFQTRAVIPAIEVERDRNILESVARHNRASSFRRKRAKAEMIEGPVGVFRAAVPRGDENREPIRPERLSHSLPTLRDVRQLLGVCPAGAELTFPALAFVVEM